MSEKWILYHAGFQEIREADVHYGRKNADFGQGFYMSDDPEFARRWAKQRKGSDTIVNVYELETDNLQILRLARDEDWFAYIYGNRDGKPDIYPEADVIIGPIANDTIYNTLGIFTSGLLSREETMRLLMVGGEYQQIVLKTEKAAGNLKWISAQTLTREEVLHYREIVAEEEAGYQRELAAQMERTE